MKISLKLNKFILILPHQSQSASFLRNLENSIQSVVKSGQLIFMKNILYVLILISLIVSCNFNNQNTLQRSNNTTNKDSNSYTAYKAEVAPIIDGNGSDLCWDKAIWDTLNEIWIGNTYTPDDFAGRYKACWDDSLLYLLVEITDDSILNQYSDPLAQYWDDDCIEVFIDEDASGGNHQFNYQAFAYHISPAMDAVDIGPDRKAHYYNSHIKGKITSTGHHHTWELGIHIYDSNYNDSFEHNIPKILKSSTTMGFSLAYCDNDTSEFRENFVGSVNTPGHYKNDGWIDASCFGKLHLVEKLSN